MLPCLFVIKIFNIAYFHVERTPGMRTYQIWIKAPWQSSPKLAIYDNMCS